MRFSECHESFFDGTYTPADATENLSRAKNKIVESSCVVQDG